MEYKELFIKYQLLMHENENLKEEIKRLKTQLGVSEQPVTSFEPLRSESDPETEDGIASDIARTSSVHRLSDPEEKIELFMSLFKGRDDVYARRWENKKKDTAGYSPACTNEWKRGLCKKPEVRCSGCTHKAYAIPDDKIIGDHLRGRDGFVAGIYPLLPDETCFFLAIDEGEWQKDISVLREVCAEFDIPVSVERSRSGKGAHAWFFFENPVAASLARKFGSALLTCAMGRRHEITFKSYDRFFPNQDTMPKGGLGNLIALPLQRAARRDKNSEFIDHNFHAYDDQWSYLAGIRRLAEAEVERLVQKLGRGGELGSLLKDEENDETHQVTARPKLVKDDFQPNIEIIKANMLLIPKTCISQRGLNFLKRLAAFQNPEFYKAQALRLSTRNIPRIISCSDETASHLSLPRGCETDVKSAFEELGIDARFVDKTNRGKNIDVEFNGSLRDEQQQALDKLLSHDTGVLCGTTAFGKTVIAIKLIAERKVNTLIIVDRISLVSQWRKRLSEFLTIHESLHDEDLIIKRGRKKIRTVIGQLGAGKNTLNGIIDIAVMQSLNRKDEVRDCMQNYGMLIVDECHHVSAFSFEQILKNAAARYVYGLTATPTRKDGHHPIIFMQCGPIRYRDDPKKQAEKRPFEHFVIPRFTPLRFFSEKDEKDVSIHELYSEIVTNEVRNQLIVEDVVKSHENGRQCIILAARTAHVELLAKSLLERIPEVISLTGGMGRKETDEIFRMIADMPADKRLVLVATGKFIGEGFDEPRLDTLFLVAPVSWKGTLQQYVGRLHRLYEDKKEVQVFDYVDVRIRMLERMYHKRLSGYAATGYKVKGEPVPAEPADIIFDTHSFLPVFSNDIVVAKRDILIVSPYVTVRRSLRMMQLLKSALDNGVKVVVITRPIEDFKDKDKVVIQGNLDVMIEAGVKIVFRSKIHQKFAVMDQRIVWYGSINLLSFGNAEESIMRLESPNIACELLRILDD
jgi:superfamily II DNA or RNA helicase